MHKLTVTSQTPILSHFSMLKWAGASAREVINFYKATVRSAAECACIVWHTGLTGEQSDRIESVQWRALNIIQPDLMCEQALAAVRLETLHACHERQAHAFYQKMQDPRHKLHHFLPKACQLTYGLRQSRKYVGQRLTTRRAKNSLIRYMECPTGRPDALLSWLLCLIVP